MNEIEGFEERLAVVERELAAVVKTIAIAGPVETLANVRRDVALSERGEALLTMGGTVTVTELGSGRVEEFAVPGGEGVAAVVHRRVRGGDEPTDETVAHPFESVVDAAHFLDLTQDATVTLVGAAAGGEDAVIELAQVAAVTFTPADAAEVAA